MKILISSLTFLGLVVAAGIVWITYPTSLESELRTFRSLPPEAFKMLRDDAIAFARANASKGITIEAAPPQSSVFELRCRRVPLLLVENGHDLLTLDIFGYADRRAPGIAKLQDQMTSRLIPEGQPGKPGPISGEPSGLEALIMKHRDGVDVAQQCH
ncbi:hypothetical protein [Stenotrophomonas pavanii]|uniref:hypothetical protein n=1 Tax=Stenotrophomonas pavanii TaxID=487698 RepID=UPI002E795ED7|nr:hypothetical protein [Stenotrophomonas pavanii]